MGEYIARRRDLAGEMEDEAAEGLEVELLRVDVYPECFHEVVQIDSRLNAPFVRSGCPDERLFRRIKFIPNLTDHLFEQVFQRHQPRRAAVLIHDDGHVRSVLLEVLKHVVQLLGKRYEARLTRQFLQVERALLVVAVAGAVVAQVGEEVLRVDHAENVVEMVAEERQARVARVADELEGFGQRRGVGQGNHVHAADHHLADGRFAELEDRVDQRALFFFQRTLRLAHIGHRFYILRRKRPRRGPEVLLQPRCAVCHERSERGQKPGKGIEQNRGAFGKGYRVPGRSQFWGDFADHEKHEREGRDFKHEGHGFAPSETLCGLHGEHGRQDGRSHVRHGIEKEDGDQQRPRPIQHPLNAPRGPAFVVGERFAPGGGDGEQGNFRPRKKSRQAQ